MAAGLVELFDWPDALKVYFLLMWGLTGTSMRPRTLLIAFTIWLAVTLFFSASVMARYIGEHKSFTYVFYATGVHYALWTLLWPLISRLCARWPLFGAVRPANTAIRIAGFVLLGIVVSPLVSLAYLATIFWTYFPYRQF